MMKAKNLSVFILLTLLLSGLMFGCKAPSENPKTENGRQDECGKLYEMAEFLEEEQFDAYINGDDALFCKLIDFKRRLTDSPELEFYAFANNFVEIIEKEIPKKCVVNHDTVFESESEYKIDGESITATEAIQVSENFFTLFPLKITEGRCFIASDFECREGEAAKILPVILGEAYRGTFALGDTFEGYYICERKKFSVIGFTDAESVFYLRGGNRMEAYESNIIMPFVPPTEDSYAARAVLLQQICGFILPRNSRSSAVEAIRKYLVESGLENWSEAIRVNEKNIQDNFFRFTIRDKQKAVSGASERKIGEE